MDILLTDLLNIYFFLLWGGGLTALVFQIRSDLRDSRDNPLEPWRLKWSDALLLLWGLVVTLLLLSIVLGKVSKGLTSPHQQILLFAAGLQGGLLLAIVLALRLYPGLFRLCLNPARLGLWQVLRQAVPQFLTALILFIPVALCWQQALAFLEQRGYGSFSKEQEIAAVLSQGSDLPAATLASLIIVAVVVAPITEEILFRGLLYRFLKSIASPRWALIISSMCFGAFHENVLLFLPLTFLGTMLVRAYERTGSLKVPILMHGLFNANSTLIILFGSV